MHSLAAKAGEVGRALIKVALSGLGCGGDGDESVLLLAVLHQNLFDPTRQQLTMQPFDLFKVFFEERLVGTMPQQNSQNAPGLLPKPPHVAHVQQLELLNHLQQLLALPTQ